MTTSTVKAPHVPDWIDRDKIAPPELRAKIGEAIDALRELIPAAAATSSKVQAAADALHNTPVDSPDYLGDAGMDAQLGLSGWDEMVELLHLAIGLLEEPTDTRGPTPQAYASLQEEYANLLQTGDAVAAGEKAGEAGIEAMRTVYDQEETR